MCSGSRIEAITRRTRYELRKGGRSSAQGLLVALLNLDAIIDLIHNAADAPTARQVNKFLWSF